MSAVLAPARTKHTLAAGDHEPEPPRVRSRHHLGPYLGYVGYFVGAGLISGGIVHYPLDPSRYTQVALAGIVLFVAATLLNEVVLPGARPSLGAVAHLVGAALLLSLGIGMLSGGIQHFMDFPARAALLIPLGLVASFVAYVIKHATHRRVVLARLGLAVLATALALAWGLSHVATSVAATGEHGHAPAVVEPSGADAENRHIEPPALEVIDPIDTGTTSPEGTTAPNSHSDEQAAHHDAHQDTGH